MQKHSSALSKTTPLEKKRAHDFPTSSYAIAGACLFGAPLEEQFAESTKGDGLC